MKACDNCCNLLFSDMDYKIVDFKHIDFQLYFCNDKCRDKYIKEHTEEKKGYKK